MDYGAGFDPFHAGVPAPYQHTARAIAAADLNGDGFTDLVYAVNNGYYNPLAPRNSQTANNNRVYLGDGKGGFADAPTSPAMSRTDETYSVAVADLNGDGHPDIVFGNARAANQVLLGEGTGGFAPAPPGPATEYAHSPLVNMHRVAVAVADLNGDGHPDLVYGEGGYRYGCTNCPVIFFSRLRSFLGDGLGSFAAGPTIPSPSASMLFSMAIADFNGDGHLDLACASDRGPNSVYLGDGTGAFPTIHGFKDHPGGTLAVAAADLNGDGHPDLVFGNRGGPNHVYLGDGAGGFAEAPASPATAVHLHGSKQLLPTTAVAVADWNGDGRLDLLCGGGALAPRMYLGDGLGGFTDGPASRAMTFTDRALLVVVAADLNGDARPDLLYARDFGGQIFLASGQGGFVDPPGDPGIASGSYLEGGVAVADFNRDGRADLVCTSSGQNLGERNTLEEKSSRNRVYLGDGQGTFTEAPASPATGEFITDEDRDGDGHLDRAYAKAVAVADFNGDSYPDIVFGVYGRFMSSRARSRVYLGDGKGGFKEAPASPATTDKTIGAVAVAVADFNGDAHPDLVYGTGRNHINRVYLGDGKGGFTTAPASPATAFYHSTLRPSIPAYTGGGRTLAVAVADLNGDAHPDLVYGNEDGSNLVYLGDGKGGFTSAPASPATAPYHDKYYDAHHHHEYLQIAHTRAIAAADFNQDGHQDLVFGIYLGYHNNATGISSRVYLGDGKGGFEEAPASPATTDYQDVKAVAVADLNGDGRPDLVYGVHRMPNRAYLGDGAGGFTAMATMAGRAMTQAVAVADLNGDGRPDLVFVNDRMPNTVHLNLATRCPGGSGLAVNDTPTAWCRSCPAYAFGAVSRCFECDAGRTAGRPRSSSCAMLCPLGTFRANGMVPAMAMCERCPFGQVTATPYTGNAACAKCAANEYAPSGLAVSSSRDKRACRPCPSNSTAPAGSSSLLDCQCAPSFFNANTTGHDVDCVALPARFSSVTKATCEASLQFGLRKDAAAADNAQLGIMVKFLAGFDTARLVDADFNDVCEVMLHEYDAKGDGSICGRQFRLFGKHRTSTSVPYLGRVSVTCHGKYAGRDLPSLMAMCTKSCMLDETSKCCWVPKRIAPLFPCCRTLGCCPDQSGQGNDNTQLTTLAPTSAPSRAQPVCGCTRCMSVSGVTKAQCESFGIDCSCVNATKSSRHAQGGTAAVVAVDVEYSSSSASRFDQLMNCMLDMTNTTNSTDLESTRCLFRAHAVNGH